MGMGYYYSISANEAANIPIRITVSARSKTAFQLYYEEPHYRFHGIKIFTNRGFYILMYTIDNDIPISSNIVSQNKEFV